MRRIPISALHGERRSSHAWMQSCFRSSRQTLRAVNAYLSLLGIAHCVEPSSVRGADSWWCPAQIPRFAFEKFPGATSTLTTQMKSVGEAMAMGRTFQESFQKALRSLETGLAGWSLPRNWKPRTRQQLEYNLRVPNPDRMLIIKQASPPPPPPPPHPNPKNMVKLKY